MIQNFAHLLIRLQNIGVDFVLVGGFAGVVHGCTIVTMDVDIACEFSAENLLRLQSAISDLHPVHRMTPSRKPFNLTSDNCQHLKNLYLDTDLGQLDCLGSIAGIGDFQTIKNASEYITIDDCKIRVLTTEALILSKNAMGRPHDQELVRELQALRNVKQKQQENIQ